MKSHSDEFFLNKLKLVMEKFSNTFENFLIINDFNMSPENKMINFSKTFCLGNLVNEPTCVKSATLSGIDLVLTNKQWAFMESGSCESRLSDWSRPQITLQNKDTTVQIYWKMSNQNTNNSRGIECALYNYTGNMGIDNFDCQQACVKKLWRTYGSSWTFPYPDTSHYTFSWTSPPSSKRTYFVKYPLLVRF